MLPARRDSRRGEDREATAGKWREGVGAEASARRRRHGRTDERGIPRVRGIGMEVGNRRTGGRIPSVLTLVRLMGTALFSPLALDVLSTARNRARQPTHFDWPCYHLAPTISESDTASGSRLSTCEHVCGHDDSDE